MKQFPIGLVSVFHNSEDVAQKFCEHVSALNVAQVVVVDAGSTDSTLEILKRFPEIQVISCENVGFGNANNLGASKVTQPWLMFVNPDLFILRNDLETLFDFSSNLEQRSITSTRMYQIIDERRRYTRESRFEGTFVERPKVSGALMLMQSSLFSDLEGFDQNIFLYFEEIDLCWRARKLGAKVLVLGTAEAEHMRAASAPSSDKYLYLRAWHDGWSKSYFQAKHSRSKLHSLFLRSKSIAQSLVKYLTALLMGRGSKAYREKHKAKGMIDQIRGISAFEGGQGRHYKVSGK